MKNSQWHTIIRVIIWIMFLVNMIAENTHWMMADGLILLLTREDDDSA